MLLAFHYLIATLYVILPVAALLAAGVRAGRTRNGTALTGLAMTAAVGITLGLSLNLVYATATGGGVLPSQVALAAYFGTAMLLLLKLCDRLLQLALDRVFGLHRMRAADAIALADDTAGNPPPPASVAVPRARLRRFLAGVVRVVLLFGVGLPYVMAAVLTYRPKVAPDDNPQEQLGFAYESVRFDATDGTSLAGWWIAASPPRTGRQSRD